MPYERQKRYERRKSAEAADIGEIPAIADPARREACEFDLRRFLQTYFPDSTGLSPFSGDHERVIDRIQRCVLEGGLFVQAVFRGFAKTTIAENSAIWATSYGHRRFVPVFGADAGSASGNIDSIKLELSENDLLLADFPEICHPIRSLEGKPQRCASQTHTVWLTCDSCGGSGKILKESGDAKPEPPREVRCVACGGLGKLGDVRQTHIEWRGDTIVLPSIRGSSASGAIIAASGLMGASRGMKHKGADGVQQRPDFVLIDDPQTDESASTPLQVLKRLNVIRKSILKLGGHNRKMAAVVNATVIRPDDLIEQLLDPKRFPAWQGERIRMVRAWSKSHETLWLGDYARLRNTFDPEQIGDQRRAHREATDFYKRNREKMDAECVVSWDHCFDKSTELSAIQHAYNCLIDDGPDVFASECQNEPLREEAKDADALKPAEIAAKTNGMARGAVPTAASRVVAFVDVQKNVLYWMVVAFAEDFSGFVLDYGTWPDQRRSYFAYRDVRRTLKVVTKAVSLEEQIYAGLDSCIGELMAREWTRDDGAQLKIERLAIDANWGDSTDIVFQFCRQSPHAAVLIPSHGRYVGATSRPFRDYRNNPGDRAGLNWRIPNVSGRRQVRYVLWDTNFWKSFYQSRLRVQIGGKGCLSLFGDSPEPHRMFADHTAAEYGQLVEVKDRRVVEFKLKPGQDNHLLDCVVGCHVVASVQGVNLIKQTDVVVKRVKLSDLQKEKRKQHPHGRI